MTTIFLTSADQGLAREVIVGQSVVIQLEETPSTGYRWTMKVHPEDAVEVLESRWIAPAGTGIGAAGKREFDLKIKARGEIRLDLKLWREWQGESSVIQRSAFTLQAHL